MSRKCSDINVLKDDSVPLTTNQPSTEEFIIITRKRRTKVQCFCSKCNGNLVDLRTKKVYDKKLTLESSFTGKTHSPIIPPKETHNLLIILPGKTYYLPVILPEEIPISQVFIESTVKKH